MKVHIVARIAISGFAIVVFGSMACINARGTRAPSPELSPGASDGLNVSTTWEPATARRAAIDALRVNGFVVDAGASSDDFLHTRTRAVSSDTALVVAAMITPVDLSPTRSMVTLSATFSVPRAGIRNAQLVRHAGTANGLWRYLDAIADSLKHLQAQRP